MENNQQGGRGILFDKTFIIIIVIIVIIIIFVCLDMIILVLGRLNLKEFVRIRGERLGEFCLCLMPFHHVEKTSFGEQKPDADTMWIPS